MTKTYIDELAEEIATLRDYYAKAITREREMATKFNNAYWESLQLKELLKECREALGFAQGFYGYCKIKNYPCVNTNNFKDDESKIETCLTQIDEALKWQIC